MTDQLPMPSRLQYLGIFLLSAAIIIFELTITRLLSVTLYYHLAFLVISIVMLGLSLGAMLVYCGKERFPQEQISSLLTRYCLGFAILAPLSTIVHVLMPLESSWRLLFGICILSTCALFCVTFIFAGICTCLVLTRFPEKTNSLYAADLVGAAIGCYAFALTLGPLDGISETFLVGAIGCLAAWCFSKHSDSKANWSPMAGAVMFLAVSILNSYCVNFTNTGLRISWMHGSLVGKPLLERWSPLGRITVSGYPNELMKYCTLGYSAVGPQALGHGLDIDIDGSARTVMVGYNDKPAEVQFLQYDVAYLTHHLRPNADVLIIGSGGGKDVVAALAFGQSKVTGVELNRNIFEILNHNYADFTGHLNRLNNVTFVNDEARHYISHSQQKHDIIQMSLIDTWAATASGAFILSENCLYTVEAWTDFLKHLRPGGIFTVSRWYKGDPPAEMLRTVSLASAALRQIGINDPQRHIILVKNGSGPVAEGTLLVGLDEFGKDDVKRVVDVCRRMHFDCILAPGMPHSELFSNVMNQSASLSGPFNFTAPTDDSPFFFNMVKLSQIFSLSKIHEVDQNWQAILILLGAVILAVYGSLLLTILPLRFAKEVLDRKAAELGLYFFSIGLGFMFIEISQIQRLIVVLGHPSYGLTCVLFTLLLSGGAGSLCSKYFARLVSGERRLILFPLISLVLFGVLSSKILPGPDFGTELARIVYCSLVLFGPGFCMGFAFPLGMRLVAGRSQNLAPWFWGLNGAGSICGSVLALLISITMGITYLFWTGVACYVVSLIAYFVFCRKTIGLQTQATESS